MKMPVCRTIRALLTLALGLVPASSAFAAYTVIGKFVYEDREFDLDGFTGAVTLRPIRFADVRILANGFTIAQGATAADGEFAIGVTDVVPSLSAVCVTSSEQTPPLLLNVRVANNDFTFGDFYSVSSATFSTVGNSGIIAVGTTVAKSDTDVGKAFNIWDVLVDGKEFVGSSQANGSLPGVSLTAIWRETHNRTGSFFSDGRDKYIYVGSISPYNDTVIAHEFGHYIDAVFSRSNSPGGSHVLGDNTQDIRLSWAEGLATFLGSSIRAFKGYPRPDIYVSTDGTNLSFSYEIESLSGSTSIASKAGSTNEIAVTAALWDIVDGPGVDDGTPGMDDDPIQRPVGEVWRDLTQYMPSVTGHDLSVEDFWDGWFVVRNGGLLTDLQAVFAGINGIEFLPDPLEADDAAAGALFTGAGRIPPLLGGERVLINEVDVGRVDAVELYNAGNSEVDLAGWKVVGSARGFPTATFVLPPFKLAAGAFVTLSEAAGAYTDMTLYFGENISWANDSDGACSLYDRWGAGEDFVRWGDSTEPRPPNTGFGGANPPAPSAGKDLCRDFGSTDSDSGSDWSGQTPSLGTYNLNGNTLHHTHYPAGDVDFAAFAATAGAEYTIETFNLANGAVTVLDILAADGATVLQSAGGQPGQSKSARLRWIAPSAGRYFVRSRRSDEPSNLARYGSYDLRIVTRAPLLVGKGTEGWFDTVAAAIEAATSGDTIEIQDSSVYRENLTIAGKNLTVRAARGQSPIVDGGGDPALPALELNAPRIRIEGIRVMRGSPDFHISGGAATITNAVVYLGGQAGSPSEGIRVEGPGASALLMHCTVAGNTGAGVAVLKGGSVRILNSILAGNLLADLFVEQTAAGVTVTHTLIESAASAVVDGNLAGDPRFADRWNFDYHLLGNSPAIDAGDGAAAELPALDASGLARSLDGHRDGSGAPDMGAYEFLPQEALISTSLFPQVALGGGYRTTLVALNPAGQDAQVRLDVAGAGGKPVSEAVLSLPGSQPALTIAPLGMASLEAGAPGNTISGYARFRGSRALNGAALFQLIRGDRVAGEAGVGPAPQSRHFTIYVDNTGNARSGYAIANPNDAEANITLTLRNADGGRVAAAMQKLAAGGHMAEFAYERFVQAGMGFEGSLDFESDLALCAVALRYDNEAQDVFSTIPVLADGLSSALYFPQIADGAGYRTNLVFVNPNDTAVPVRIEFIDGNGSQLRLPLGGSLKTGESFSIPAKGARSFRTDGTASELRTGWVRVAAGSLIGGTAIIQTLAGSKIVAEAGVAASPSGRLSLSYMESRGYSASGVAICNPNAQAVPLTLQLRNSAGEIVAARSLLLPGMGQVARFFTEWFPIGFDEFAGTLQVQSEVPVAAVALRYDNPPGDVFATLPVAIIR